MPPLATDVPARLVVKPAPFFDLGKDARVKRLAVTVRGRRLATQAVTIVDIADADFFKRAHDRGQLLDVLHQLADGPSPEAALRLPGDVNGVDS